MLSPHEFATLMLVIDSPEQVEMDRPELDQLLERQLVELESLGGGHQQLRVTREGQHLMRNIKARLQSH